MQKQKSEPSQLSDLLKDQFRISGLSDQDYLAHVSSSDCKNNANQKLDDKGNSLFDSFDSDDDDDDDGKDNDEIFAKPINSAFDINLAEFPIAYLNRGGVPKNASKTEIIYSDYIKGRDGEPISRRWSVQATSVMNHLDVAKLEEQKGRALTLEEKQLGFGGPQTLEVIYELFQLWKEQSFQDNKIHIGTYYHLLKRLGWATGSSDYKLLKKTLQCIHGIHFEVSNALYVPTLDKYETRSFYLFPSLRTYSKSEKDLNPDDYLFITVDENFHQAIKAKTTYYIPFDRHYFKTLKPMEQKLALMLAKVFTPYKRNQRFEWKRSVEKVAQQIPIVASEVSQIKRQLKRTCDGLIQKNFPFLSKYAFDGDNIIFYNNIQTALNLSYKNDNYEQAKDPSSVEWLIDEQLKVCGDKHSIPFYSIVAKHVPADLVYECLSEAKQDGIIKCKLYTKIMKEKGRKYLEKYINYSSTSSDLDVDKKEANRIKYEIDISRMKEKASKVKPEHDIEFEDNPND